MPIRVALHHRTTYAYDKLVNLGPQVVRLRPAPHCRTPVLSYSLKVVPEKHFINWQQDPHGNFLARLVFLEQTRKLRVTVDLVAEMTVINPFDFFLQEEANEFPFAYEDAVRTDLLPFLETLPQGPRMKEYMAGVPRRHKGTVDFLVDLNQYTHRAVKYLIRMEPGVQTCEETLNLQSGSCRDSAWLLVQTLRNLGLAARFVSGYLIQLTPDMKPLDGPPGPSADFTDLHAWAEVYLPGAGWVGLDPTSGLLAGEGHLPLAATPSPDSASPISGCVDNCEVDFSVQMSVTRVADAPRVTKPYTEEQWAAVERLGHKVDARLEALDVRLTMGGEPTFVSIDDMEGPEWNMTADSPDKRRLAGISAAAAGPLLRSRRAAALRPGQVVSRRAAAALGTGLLLAQGRRADLEQSGADRGRRNRLQRQSESGPTVHPAFGPAAGSAGRRHRAGLRRRLVLHVERTAAAGQCRSAEVEPRGRTRAEAAGADFRARPR